MRYTAEELRDMPTLTVGQADDLKVDTGNGTRVWLSRLTDADGASYSNQVTVERYDGNAWVIESEYQG